ncbi:hypothetical protein C0J52_25594 [Blattella germanica]|nr:hypothetical protein C0J52_25594 [Blattella germanica]
MLFSAMDWWRWTYSMDSQITNLTRLFWGGGYIKYILYRIPCVEELLCISSHYKLWKPLCQFPHTAFTSLNYFVSY